MPQLPADLNGPVAVELARAEDEVPGPGALPGGCVYEPKWDGFRLVIVRRPDRVRLWSRQGRDLTRSFPDVEAAALTQLAPGTVLDGEVVVWNGAALDFDLLSARLAGTARRLAAQARAHPASYVAFDLLADRGADLRGRPWAERRAALEALGEQWAPPLTLSPATTDRDTALAWFTDYRAAGLEGLVVKGSASRYTPNRRGWVKVKSRESAEVLIGAVVGPLSRPREIVVGLPDPTGRLRVVGRSTALTSAQAAALARLLSPPTGAHPWPPVLPAGRFGADPLPITRVRPQLVAEVSADVALSGGRYRHPVRFLRTRPELTAADLPPLPPR